MVIGRSVLSDGRHVQCINTETRCVARGDAVDVYRNLAKGNHFSVKARQGQFKGNVVAYGEAILVATPRFVCSEPGRQRVIAAKQKNVHAVIRAALVDIFDCVNHNAIKNWYCATYVPYLANTLIEREALTRDGTVLKVPEHVLTHARCALLYNDNVYLN